MTTAPRYGPGALLGDLGLLQVDGASKRAKALPGSSQAKYHIMPADYIVMAIPLSAGNHHFSMVYRPRAFSIGLGISICAAVFYLAALVFLFRKLLVPGSSRRIRAEKTNA